MQNNAAITMITTYIGDAARGKQAVANADPARARLHNIHDDDHTDWVEAYKQVRVLFTIITQKGPTRLLFALHNRFLTTIPCPTPTHVHPPTIFSLEPKTAFQTSP